MLIIPSSVKIHLALGHTDLRKGFDSLAVLVQEGAQEGFVLGLSLRLEQPRCPSPYRRMSDHVQSPPRRIKIVIDVSPPTISSQRDRRLAFRLVLALQLRDQDKAIPLQLGRRSGCDEFVIRLRWRVGNNALDHPRVQSSNCDTRCTWSRI
jgi:hypothetical protein